MESVGESVLEICLFFFSFSFLDPDMGKGVNESSYS